MRRFVCLLVAVLLCTMMVYPAMAATDTFVPSIGYKDGPNVEDATMNGEEVDGCIVVSSLKQAEEKTTDISQEDRDLLLDIYKQLNEGTMELPPENESYVIRELVDVSFAKSDCVDKGHSHKQWLAEAGNTITISFDLGVKKTTEVTVMTYVNGQWVKAESVVNNGDGTITCVLEDICPVVFCLNAYEDLPPAQTGDVAGNDLILWIALMAVSATGIAVMCFRRRRAV